MSAKIDKEKKRKDMTRTDFAKLVKSHDWYFQYSNGNTYYRGVDSQRQLMDSHQALDCPFSFGELQLWSYNAIREDMVEVDGKLYRPDSPQRAAYVVSEEATISREDCDKVSNWLTQPE